MPKQPITKTPVAFLRVILNRSRGSFAKDHGLNPHTLQKVEQGKFRLSNDYAVLIANKTGVSVSWLQQKEHLNKIAFGTGVATTELEIPHPSKKRDYADKQTEIRWTIAEFKTSNDRSRMFWTKKSIEDEGGRYPKAYDRIEKQFAKEWGPKKEGKFLKWEKWQNPDGTTPDKDIEEIEQRTKKYLETLPPIEPEIDALLEKQARENSLFHSSRFAERIERILWSLTLNPTYHDLIHIKIDDMLREVERELGIEPDAKKWHSIQKAMLKNRSTEFTEMDERATRQKQS